MRLILTLRGVPVIDLELRLPTNPEPEPERPTLEATDGGQAERADTYGDPATIAGFGLRA